MGIFKAILYLLSSLVISFSVMAVENINIVGLVERSLKEVSTPFRYTCGETISEINECPHMVKQFENDTKTGPFYWMLADSPWQSCQKTIPSSSYIEVNSLEKQLASNTHRDLGLVDDYFTNQIEECFDYESKTKEQVKKQKKAIVSISYNYLNKIKNNTHDLSKEMVNINSLLGLKLTSDVPCDEFNMPHDSAYCTALLKNNCKPVGGLETLSNDLVESAIEPIHAIALKIKEERGKFTGRGGSVIRQQRVKKLKAKIEFIMAEHPILRGNILSDFIDDEMVDDYKLPTKSEFQNKLKEQMVENKKTLSNKLERNRNLNHCILYGDDDICDNFEDDFRDLPYESTPMHFTKEEASGSKDNRMSQLAREELYQVPECIDRSRNLKNDFNSFATETSINVGLTLLTGGSVLVLRAGQLGKMALAAQAATLGADAAFLSKGVSDAINTCNKELNGLEKIKKSDDKNLCPKNLNSPEYIRTSNVRGCVTAALLSSIDALPFVPAIASKTFKNSRGAEVPSSSVTNSDQPLKEFQDLIDDKAFKNCVGRKASSKICKKFSEKNRERLTDLFDKCLKKSVSSVNRKSCQNLEKFLNDNEVLRLSSLIPPEKQGKSVVVELNSGRGHITLRYFKEVLDENGDMVMKAFSYDGTSWLFPRRVNENMLKRSKNADSFDSLDKVVPGSHYVVDISPEQVETIHSVAKKGGFSKACTHDARIALDEAGVLSMPKGLNGTLDKITIKKLAKDLTAKYGKPRQSTIKALEDALDSRKAGFSDEQWRTFTVTELGWAVLTPVMVGGTYPVGAMSAGMIVITVVDQDGKVLSFTKEKYQELIEAMKSE